MTNIEICIRSEENNLGLYVRGSNEMLLKGVKKSVLCLMEKEDFKKNCQNKFQKMAQKENVWTVCS